MAEQELHDEPDDESEGISAALMQQRAERARLAWRDLQRLANWVAVYDGYVKQDPQPERIAEVVYRLEAEVLGRATVAGRRIATLRVGEPLTLPEKLERRELSAWTLQLENAVGALLRST
jgi:hypothetical protein